MCWEAPPRRGRRAAARLRATTRLLRCQPRTIPIARCWRRGRHWRSATAPGSSLNTRSTAYRHDGVCVGWQRPPPCGARCRDRLANDRAVERRGREQPTAAASRAGVEHSSEDSPWRCRDQRRAVGILPPNAPREPRPSTRSGDRSHDPGSDRRTQACRTVSDSTLGRQDGRGHASKPSAKLGEFVPRQVRLGSSPPAAVSACAFGWRARARVVRSAVAPLSQDLGIASRRLTCAWSCRARGWDELRSLACELDRQLRRLAPASISPAA